MTLRRELRDALDEPHDEQRAHANWEAIERKRRPTPAFPARRGIAVLGLAAAALVAVGVLAMPRAPGPLRLPDGAEARGVLAASRTTLDDGSVITLADAARLEVLENAGDHVRFWLHEGRAHFDVVPGGPRRWAIESGGVTVEVLGTAFEVDRTEGAVEVAVDRGSVLVRGPTAPGGMQRLRAGESITVAIEARTLAATEDAPSPEPAAPPSTLVPSSPPPREEPPASHVSIAALAPGSREAAPVEPSADAPAAVVARLRDVDTLRAQGRIDEAVALLVTIEDDPSAGRERPLAAYTRARLLLDRRDQPREAASAIDRAITLGLRAPLLEDARARRVEALARAGDAEGARAAAAEYRAHHPDGRWIADVDRWSATP
ncbi:MAG: FecR family protein [Sandaracinus sp.]